MEWARQGDPGAALVVLERLRAEHPHVPGLVHDLIVIYGWAGRHAEAARLFAGFEARLLPAYVIDAAALSYRRLGRAEDALALYRLGRNQAPGHAPLVAGEVRTLVDLEQIEQAVATAEDDLKANGDRVAVLLAAGYAATAQERPVDALRYLDRALTLEPASREATHDRIQAISRMGAPELARRLAEENPEVVSSAEMRRIDGDTAAALVRWGVLEAPSEELRFVATDRAIAALDTLIEDWSRDGDAAGASLLRARFDRIVALRDRVRMTEVVTEYERLAGQGSVPPDYVLIAAADAYLYLRQPETARDLYLRTLKNDPRNLSTRLGLFYAYVELDDFDAAYRQVDSAVADQAIWLRHKGLNDTFENPDRASADLSASNARLYGDELAQAHLRILAMAESAPNNTRHRTALANLYSARGWHRLAAEEYEISRALEPKNAGTEAGEARNNLQRRNYPAADAQLADLKRRFPENLEVRRLDRLWQVHNRAEFHLTAEKALLAATNIQGGTGIAVDAGLYSPPIEHNWRIFATGRVAHQKLPIGEGAITSRRSALGAEFRDPDLIASLEGTVNSYESSIGNALWGSLDQGRGGARAQAAWSASDYWQIGGGAEIFARNTPLRALRHGITANAAATEISYRESESRALRLGVEAMSFSDGNFRTSLSGRFVERLATSPALTVDGILGLATSGNSADANRPYYNPRQATLGSFGVSINHLIHRRYEFVYDHHLVVTPGIYREEGFGQGPALSILYEHRVRAHDVIDAGLGLSFGRQPYDGVSEDNLTLLFNLRWRL